MRLFLFVSGLVLIGFQLTAIGNENDTLNIYISPFSEYQFYDSHNLEINQNGVVKIHIENVNHFLYSITIVETQDDVISNEKLYEQSSLIQYNAVSYNFAHDLNAIQILPVNITDPESGKDIKTKSKDIKNLESELSKIQTEIEKLTRTRNQQTTKIGIIKQANNGKEVNEEDIKKLEKEYLKTIDSLDSKQTAKRELQYKNRSRKFTVERIVSSRSD